MKFGRKIMCFISVIMVLTVMSTASTAVVNNDFGYRVTAERENVAGVELDSGFFVHREGGLSAADLEDRLTILPAVDFQLIEKSETEVFIQIEGELSPRTVYSIRINDGGSFMSWAFQTKEIFRVTRTLPAEGRIFIPVDSGIELFFSQPVDMSEIAANITILPELEGRFQQIDPRHVVFVPTQGMSHGTMYTVTLDGMTSAISGDVLGEEFRFDFTTQYSVSALGANFRFRHHDKLSETFLPDDPIVIRLNASSELENEEVSVRLYRFPGLDEYLSALSAHYENPGVFVEAEGLELVGEIYQRLIMNRDMFWNVAFLPMPENPGEGWYLADIRPVGEAFNDMRAQKLIQVTDISVYSQTSNGQILFWINDAATGESLEGAEISVGGHIAVTDEYGLALLTLILDDGEPLRPAPWFDYGWFDHGWFGFGSFHHGSRPQEVRITHGERGFGDYLDFLSQREPAPRDLYFGYVYTDREAYQPDDIVRFWGVAAPRRLSSPPLESITLNWTDGGRFPEGIEIPVNPDGTFSGEIELVNRASGWTQLRFDIDGQPFIGSSFTVMEYVRPIYTASITLDRPYYRQLETITATVQVNFFDGTPASGVEVTLTHWSGGWSGQREEHQLITDADGTARAYFNAGRFDNWRPTTNSIWGTIGGVEHRRVFVDQFYHVFPRDYIMEGSIVHEDDQVFLVLDAHAIDFTRTQDFMRTWRLENLRGVRADMTGRAVLHEVTFVRHRIGEFYDFINSRVVNRYRFERVETAVGIYGIIMEDGRLRMPLDIDPGETERFYFVTLDLTAPDGTRFSQTIHAPGHRHFISDTIGATRFHFSSPGNTAIGELAEIELRDQDGNVPEGGRLLYTVLGREHMLANVIDHTRFEVEFLPEYVPNVTIVGAYFTGRHIYIVHGASFFYDREESRLDIAITADQERYAPGDTVTLDIEITDREGRGVPASFLVSVADEAVFAIIEQYVNPLQTIFRSEWHMVAQFASYIEPLDVNFGAEGGEGGSDAIRREFVDTAAFIKGTADEHGRAAITFDLPDNLTSWRLTGLAFSDNYIGEINVPLAGNTRENISVGLPFFINQILNSRYLSGDSIGISIRAAGSAVGRDEIVLYTVTLTGNGISDTLTARGRAGQYTTLYFDPLPPGTYTILTQARLGDFTDAIEIEIEVVTSSMITSRSQSGNLVDGIDIDPLRFPVRITLFDLDNRLYYDVLFRLLHSFGERADQRIVRALAGEILNKLSETSIYPARLNVDTSEFWSWNNFGIRLFPFAESDVMLTAKAAAAAPHFFDSYGMIRYFTRIIDNADSHPVDIAAAYMGLAAFSEPVLPELREALANRTERGLTYEEQLAYAVGLALLGDILPALEWYETVLRTGLVQNGDEIRIAFTGIPHVDYVWTANAAMLTALAGHPDHHGLITFLLNNSSPLHLPLLELAVFAARHIPNMDSTAAFSYNLDGREITFDFGRTISTRLELGERQLAEADFAVISGNVGYTVQFQGGMPEEIGFPDGISVETIIESPTPGTIRVGDRVRVITTITFDAGTSRGQLYHIRQALPSGLRFIDAYLLEYDGVTFAESDRRFGYRIGNRRIPFFFWEGEGGVINFHMSSPTSDLRRPASITFLYEARAVLPGEYILEATALSLSGNDTLFRGVREVIYIER